MNHKMSDKNNYKKETILARAAIEDDIQYGAVIAPIHVTSTFTFDGVGNSRHYNYTRSGNPTRDKLGDAISSIENGAGCIVTSSGMSAILLSFHLIKQGDLIIAPHDCYGATFRLLNSYNDNGFFKVEFVNQTDEKALDEAFAKKPALILIETPSNPLLRVTDIKDICRRAKEVGALTVADNTFLSPVLQNPIDLGADVVVHSTTKYINGHSDVIGGCAIASTPELYEKLEWWGNNLGLTGAPLDSYLTLRGLRTIELRVKHQEETAQKIVEFLDNHPKVKKVNYPGLKSHKGHELAKAQQSGFGAMLSFEIDTDLDGISKFIEKINLFSLANSLGATESLIAHPATMTHSMMTDEARKNAGISDSLIRLSIGLEHSQDLINNLDEGLENV